jgi:predicted permease
MTALTRLRSWLHAVLHRADLDRAMQEELRFHIDQYADDLERQGLSPEDAARRARAEFGSLASTKEACRQSLGLRLLDELGADLRYAFRVLRRAPAFTTVAVMSLGLGIGANTAIFTLVDAVLLKPLPVERPDRLFFVDNSGGRSGGSNAPPYPCYERLRDHNRYFSGLAAFDGGARFKVVIDDTPELIRGQYASGSFFEVLGVQAAYGRLFTPADDSEIGRGGPDGAVAVISHTLWKRRFAMSPAVLGRTIHVGTHAVTIVGVTPPGFTGLDVGSPVDLTIPITLYGPGLYQKQSWWFSVVGRLKDDAMVEPARAELDGMFQAYMNENGVGADARKYFSGIVLVPALKGLNGLRREFAEPLLIVMAIVGLVLIIGCANVANLLLARATARRSEIAVRLAIGASRTRLIRQMLTEGVALVMLGAIVGVLFARWGVTVLVGFLAGLSGRIVLEPAFDLRVLGFTASVAILTGLLFSLAPALDATRQAAARPDETGRASAGRSRIRAAQSLVILQVAVSLILLCAAALFVRTLHALNRQEAGFDREQVLTMQVEATLPPRPSPVDDPERARAERDQIGRMWSDLIDRVKDQPGAQLVAGATLTPMSGRDRGVKLRTVGPTQGSTRNEDIHLNQVTPELFETLGIRLIAGRLFTDRDRAGAPKVVILNSTAERFHFGPDSAIGRLVSFGPRLGHDFEVVGVVNDTRYESLRNPAERMAYVPILQPIDRIGSLSLAIRGEKDVTALVPPIRNEVRLAVPGGFVTGVATASQRIHESLLQERLVSTLASFFGVLALALACIGLYGVMSYAVLRRTREIGIRLAVGAQRRSVIWLVLRETCVLIAIGLALGIPAVLSLAGYVENSLYGIGPADPVALAGALAVLLTVAVLAGYLPARRASRLDPILALRHE